MTVFWLVAALLVAASLLFLLPPLARKGGNTEARDRKELNILLYKDQLQELHDDLEASEITQEQFDLAKHDLERSLLQDVAPDTEEKEKKPILSAALTSTLGSKSAVAIALIVPILAFGLYYKLGAGEAGLHPENASMSVNAKGHDGTIEQQVRKLQDHLQSNPDDLEGWVMLARSYYYMKQYQAATDAFARAVSLTKEGEPQLLADYADAMAMANGQNMMGKPYELVKKALAIQPMHQKALWLAGTATYQAKDYKSSLEYWDKLLQQFPKNSNEYVQMLRNIGEVKQLMGQPVDDVVAKLDAAKAAQPVATTADAGASGAGNTAAGGSSVSGEVSLDPSLQGRVSPKDTLFIFARAAKGPRMPLAILRMQASALPVKFTLDDSNAMNPAMRISNFPQVVVGARISKSGNAMPQDGDLSGASAVINVGAKDLKITINHAVGQNAAGQNSGSAAAASATPVAASGAAVSGEVSIDPSLKSKVSPTDTLFIFARAANGPRMPLAILRLQARALPVKFTLDDSNAMNPAMRLSNFKQVVVSARISKSGNAMPQSGDLSGDTPVINVGTKGLNVEINNAVP